MPTHKLLADMPLLRFLYFLPNFVAAFKASGQLQSLAEKYRLAKPQPFLVIPCGPKPDLGVLYFAPEIILDESRPEWIFSGVTYYKCFTDSKKLIPGNEESILKRLSNPSPGHVVRRLYAIDGGKK